MTAPEIDLSGIPAVPHEATQDTYDGVLAAISANIEAGYADPLLGLSDETELDMVAIAFHDPLKLDRLERQVKGKLRDTNVGETQASSFSLASYRKGAAHLKKTIAEAIARRRKLAARNMKVIEGSKGDEQLEGLPADAPVTDQSDLYSSSAHLQAAAWLRVNRKGRIWFDEFASNFFSDWDGTAGDRVIPATAVTDSFLVSVHTTLHRIDVRLAKSSFSNTERAIHAVGFEDRRNEPRDWIKGLQWDGEPRLETLMSRAYGTPQDEYHAAVGRCWFISMAARIMQPGAKVHTMPVFVGDQGHYKSTALEIIGGKWYGVINVSADKQNDFVGAMAGLVVAEIAELDAISGRRVENSRVKTLLSTSEDRYRPPYGRTTQVFKRTAVLAGTTNDSSWHRDDTGARRFWTVICRRAVDIEYLREFREQLFAEALHLLNEGRCWWDVPREEQERLAMEHFHTDPWEERIERALSTAEDIYTEERGSKVGVKEGDPSSPDMATHWGTLVTTNRIMTQWLQLPVSMQGRSASLNVSKAMKHLGWDTKVVRLDRERTIRCWVKSAKGAKQAELEV